VAKTIVITGAGAGLGRALARRFAAAGDTVILLGRTLSRVEAVAAELGAPALAFECDVGSADSVRAAFAAIAAKEPVIDVLINNAAIYEPLLVREASDAQIMIALTTNFAGPIFCCRSAIPMMRKGSHIINISSEAVHTPFPMFSMYQSTKAGLERFTEALHKELEEDGIRVSTVRAGQMFEEGRGWNFDPEVVRRFGEACIKAGIDTRARPISHFKSVAEAFYMLVNLPADLQTPHVVLEARHA
jgi:meso-butanediol dehydrogenase / (S,S)-butanediol dehydrogenase / diacetyl reductase